MKLAYSEVFENYAKIAKDSGIVKEAEEKSHPRYDSKDLKTIQQSYGVKPEGASDKDIIDQAHPESVIVSPSHDKVNGLVENVKERHNIMVGICRKPTNGKHTHHAYALASEELFNELIVLGFKLDNQNEEQLTVLADECAEHLTKKAALPLLAIVPAIIGAATLAYNEISNAVNMSQGLVQDANSTLEELQDVTEEFPSLQNDLRSLTDSVQDILARTNEVNSIRIEIAKLLIRIKEKDYVAAEKLINNKSNDDIVAYLKNYGDACLSLNGKLLHFKKILSITEENNKSDVPSWMEMGRKLVRHFVKSDVEDVMMAMDRLAVSLGDQASKVSEEVAAFQALVKPEVIEKVKAPQIPQI